MTNQTETARGSSEAAQAVSADAQLDCKGLLCPLPIYRTAQAIARLNPGEMLRVECTDPGSLADFPAFARQRGHTLVSAEDKDGVQVFYLRRGDGR
jgi:tRNA 2-thiouridine synthesizing protein A